MLVKHKGVLMSFGLPIFFIKGLDRLPGILCGFARSI